MSFASLFPKKGKTNRNAVQREDGDNRKPIYVFQVGNKPPKEWTAEDIKVLHNVFGNTKTLQILTEVGIINPAQDNQQAEDDMIKGAIRARLVNKSEEQMMPFLKEAANLSPDYDEFAELLFANNAIMTHGVEGIADAIYNLYSEDEGGERELNKWTEVRAFWRAIDAMNLGAFLQYEEIKVGEAVDILGSLGRADRISLATDFVYFFANRKLPATYRVYAHISSNVALQLAPMIYGHEGVNSFKFSGPLSFGERSDTMVAYCDTKEHAEALATAISGAGFEINDGRPRMTRQIGDSSGIGIGAEPAQVDTGMKTYDPTDEEQVDDASGQSFGSIRSEIFGSAVLYYQTNQGLADQLDIDDKELFKRFVRMGVLHNRRNLEPN